MVSVRQISCAALSIATAVLGSFSVTAHAAEISIRAAGQNSTNRFHVAIEREFYEKLGAAVGAPLKINYSPVDVVGVNTFDLLRLVRTGSFDIVQTTGGEAAKDDPFLEGMDLIGVSPTFDDLAKAVNAYRDAFAKRAEQKFNVKTLALWPFGPQVFYCNEEIKGFSDLRNKKVRSYTESMSALLRSLGATPVTLPFAETYPSLQRKVIDCAITSPTSGNTGKWPEVTTHYMPLGISWSVNGHFMNLDTWNKFPKDVQEKLIAEFRGLEKKFWDLARSNTTDAGNCNIGKDPCERHGRFAMQMVSPPAADAQALHEAVSRDILPKWAANCNAIDKTCSATWNATVGAARGFKIP